VEVSRSRASRTRSDAIRRCLTAALSGPAGVASGSVVARFIRSADVVKKLHNLAQNP
jgi:hypothetical protein